jgi:hypothetical protein
MKPFTPLADFPSPLLREGIHNSFSFFEEGHFQYRRNSKGLNVFRARSSEQTKSVYRYNIAIRIFQFPSNKEYPKLVMVRDPLHDNVWFKSAGDLSIFKVKYGRLWSYAHLPARVAGQRNRHRISPGHGKHMD